MNNVLVAAALVIIASPQAHAASPRRAPETLVRHPPPPSTVDMDVWLRRLVGRFRWEGTLDTDPLQASDDGQDLLNVKGIGDCVAIGSGAGVQCVLDVRWTEQWSNDGRPIAVPNLTPAMSLYGIDALRQRFVYMQVDNKGLALGGPGSLSGSTGTFRAACNGTDLPMQLPPTPGSASPAERDPFAADSEGSEDFTQSEGSGSDGSQAGSPGATYIAPLNSISVEPGPATPCLWTTRIIAAPDKDLIYVNIDYGDRMDPTNRYTLSLRRINKPSN